MKVGVVDYGVGNLGSVLQALESLRAQPVLLQAARDLQHVDRLILPGVGSFADCKHLLDAGGWTAALSDAVLGRGQALLGICLGMQLLADRGFEGTDDPEGTAGLGFIPGQVRSLASLGCSLRVPHMGWNSIAKTAAAAPDSLLDGIPDGTDFYFVHSYAFVPASAQHLVASTDHGLPVTAVVRRGPVCGTQFHPEKSSRAGFRVLRNFLQGPRC